MKYISFLFILLSFSVFLSGCNAPALSLEEKDFITLLSDPKVQDVNQSIGIKLDPVNPSKFEVLGTIDLIITNQSKKTIKFPPGGNVQIFLFSEDLNNWEEIKNAVMYYGEDVLIVPYGDGLDVISIEIRPDYQSNEIEQRMRVAVTGYVVKDGQTTDEAVSAFVEFKVKP